VTQHNLFWLYKKPHHRRKMSAAASVPAIFVSDDRNVPSMLDPKTGLINAMGGVLCILTPDELAELSASSNQNQRTAGLVLSAMDGEGWKDKEDRWFHAVDASQMDEEQLEECSQFLRDHQPALLIFHDEKSDAAMVLASALAEHAVDDSGLYAALERVEVEGLSQTGGLVPLSDVLSRMPSRAPGVRGGVCM